MPKQKKIAYRKCHQCRKDRQKCLPEKRNWPGNKCDRCQHYNYECSAMMTKGEESSTTSNARASTSAEIPSTTGSASPPIQRSEIRCLQDFGDLQQLYMILHEIWTGRVGAFSSFESRSDFLAEALSDTKQEIMVWARRQEADGRYRDAEYLIRRANSASNGQGSLEYMWSHLSTKVLPAMVALHGKMGDYTAEEKCQEKLVELLFFAKSEEEVNEEQIQAVVALSRLLSNFHSRVLDLVPDFGESDLFITYRAAMLDVVLLNKILLENGLITSETKEKHPCTSLHIAVKENAINLARQLIEMGADVNSEDWKDDTPLHIAATHGGSEMIDLLLENKAQVEGVDQNHYKPLHAAVTGKHPQETVTSLINAKAHINAEAWYYRATAMYKLTALNFAIEHDLSAIASLLLEKGANVEAPSHGEAPLFTAVHHQRTWAIDLLLDNGADLLEGNREGYNVLEFAVKMDRESIVQILLDRMHKTRSASYENGYEGLRVLHYAVKNANVSMVEMLLKARVGFHARDYDHDTVLHRAIKEGGEPHERIVKLLLERDVELERANWYGDTALHLAVRLSRRNMLVILLRHKPYELPNLCNIRNNNGSTPLGLARWQAKDKKDSSVEVSVLYLLENALKLVSATGLHKGMGGEAWNGGLV
ncbi:ankyrin repeat-containing domain protein [Usnea florida]